MFLQLEHRWFPVRLDDFRSLRLVPLAALVALAACNVDSVTDPLSPSYARGGNHKPPPPPPPPPTTHTPILFVHGWNASSSTWTTMYNRFKADGYTDAELVNWSYNYRASNRTTGQLIQAKVDSIITATGATQVNIISHSMGTISVRYYIDSLGGASKVYAFAGLGGTNHGTTTADICFDTSCVEMRPNSTLLNHLNATDESPFAVGYATWRSPCDEVINPHDSPILNGAQLNQLTACMTHSTLHEDATVYSQVKSFIEGGFTP
jgi:triacylglycerol lipase